MMCAAITNVCLTAQFNCDLNLMEIVNNTNNCKLHIRPFKRCIIKLRHPQATVFVYSTGKVISIGAKSTHEAKLSVRCVGRMIQKIGYNVQISNLLVRNIAATYDLKRKLNTLRLHTNLIQLDEVKTRFDMKVFPNLRINFIDTIDKTKYIISRNGKVIITGFKSEESLEYLINNLEKLIDSFV